MGRLADESRDRYRGSVRPVLTRRLAGFGTNVFSEMTRLALAHGAVNLAQGFPDFDGPDFVKEAGKRAIDAGRGQYGRSNGIPELHARIAERYRKDYDLRFAEGDEIVVGCGATELIFAAIAGLTDVGDEVVLMEPFYDSYRASVCMAGATPRVVRLEPPDFAAPIEALARAISPRTKVLVLNNPHNPTGKVWTRAELEGVARLCVENDVIAIADEVYEHIRFEGDHVPLASLPGMFERTITLSSLSKTFSLTGWRVGWAVAPAPLAEAVRGAHQFITFSAPTPLQWGAVAALEAEPGYVTRLAADFRAKRDLLGGALRAAGFDVYEPAGTYFVCAGFSRLDPRGDDVLFAKHLTADVGVAVIPPSAFFEAPGTRVPYVRFTFCKRDETLRAAIERLAKLRPSV